MTPPFVLAADPEDLSLEAFLALGVLFSLENRDRPEDDDQNRDITREGMEGRLVCCLQKGTLRSRWKGLEGGASAGEFMLRVVRDSAEDRQDESAVAP